VESYGFVAVDFSVLPKGKKEHMWIYLPNMSPHEAKVWQVEVMGPLLAGASTGAQCRLEFNRKYETGYFII